MSHPEPPRPNIPPRLIHNTEQNWGLAQDALDKMLESVRADIPGVTKATGLSDDSVIFDYLVTAICRSEMMFGNHHNTIIVCAAAITRLARGPSAENELAQYESEMENPNDHH